MSFLCTCGGPLCPGTHRLPGACVAGWQGLNYSQLETDSFGGELLFTVVIPLGSYLEIPAWLALLGTGKE